MVRRAEFRLAFLALLAATAAGALAPAPAFAQFRGAYAFLQAVDSRDGNKATEALKDDPSFVNTRNPDTGETALILVAKRRDPTWLRFLIGWARLHGKRFYNFDGLDKFKNKLCPDAWHPIFAISNESRLSFRTIYAIAAAFSENQPVGFVFGGLKKALATEIKWFREKFARHRPASK